MPKSPGASRITWKRVKGWLSALLVIGGFMLIFSGHGIFGCILVASPLALDWRKVRERSRTEKEIKALKYPVTAQHLVEVTQRRLNALDESDVDRRMIGFLLEKLIDFSERNTMLQNQYSQLSSQVNEIQGELNHRGGNDGRSSILAD